MTTKPLTIHVEISRGTLVVAGVIALLVIIYLATRQLGSSIALAAVPMAAAVDLSYRETRLGFKPPLPAPE